MSGIAGIISLNNQKEIDVKDVNNLAESIKYRGRDGTKILHERNYAFVYSKLSVSSYCDYDMQPYTDAETDLIIVSNSRLDNRNEIIKKFNLEKNLPDTLIILELFKVLGESCLDHLVGPFTFVIYSYKTNKIFAARDHFGQRPFYFSKTDNFFIFSSDANSILQMPGINKSLNDSRIIDYLVFQGSIENQTFYKHVLKLHRSELLLIDKKGLQIKGYFTFSPSLSTFQSDEECFKKFREIFTQVIDEITDIGSKNIASTCSGGLDSSAISSVLHKLDKRSLKIKSYSVHFPDLEKEEFLKTDERKYVEDYVKMYDANHTFLNSTIDPFEHLDALMGKSYFPPKSGNGYIHQEIFNHMNKNNIRVLLDGFDGDSVISHGLERLDELLRKFEFIKLKNEVKEACRLNKKKFTFVYFFKNFILMPLIPLRVKMTLNSLFKSGITELKKFSFLNRRGKRVFNFRERFEKFYPNKAYKFTNANESHKNGLSLPFWEEDLEMIDYISSLNGIEIRLPFMDKRLVEFCINVPAHLKMKHGIRRYYFRESMRGICPESTLEKNTKADLGPKLRISIQKNASALKNSILEDSYIKNFLDANFIKGIDLKKKKSKLDISNIYKWHVLDQWIKKKKS